MSVIREILWLPRWRARKKAQLVQDLLTRLRDSQAGFTLVELLVVVGIIVALVAVVVPSVVQFSGSGEEGGRAAELSNVQTAFDTAMADSAVTTITGIAGDTSVKDLGSVTIPELTLPITDYLRESVMNHYYCDDSVGMVINTKSATGTDPLLGPPDQVSADPCPAGPY